MIRSQELPLPCLVFATLVEAQPAIRRLQAQPFRPGNDIHIGQLPGAGQRVLLLVTGMGPESAYRAILELFAIVSVARVINLGVAGALRSHLKIGELCTVDRVIAEPRKERVIALSPLSSLPCHSLISVHTPAFDAGRRVALAAAADLVDMEGAVIARACRQHRIPCQMIKGVSDFAGTGERDRLRRNLPAVSRAIADEVLRQMALQTTGEEST